MSWQVQVCEGRPYDLMVRAAQLVMALHKQDSCQATFEKDAAYARWRHLFDSSEQVLLARLTPAPTRKGEMLNLLSRLDQRDLGDERATLTANIQDLKTYRQRQLWLHTFESAPSRAAPGSDLILLHTPNPNSTRAQLPFDGVAVFDPYNVQTRWQSLPAGVDKTVFAPTTCAALDRLLVIGSGNIQDDVAFVQSFVAAGIPKITLFDPYHFEAAYRQAHLLPVIHYAGVCNATLRAKLFATCGTVVVSDPDTRVDNHFFWEAAAVGLRGIANALPATRWTDENRRAVCATLTEIPANDSRFFVDWQQLIARVQNLQLNTQAQDCATFHIGMHTINIFASPHVAAQHHSSATRVAILAIGPQALWSNDVTEYLQPYGQVFLAAGENPTYFVAAVSELFAKQLEVITDVMSSVMELLKQHTPCQIDIIHIETALNLRNSLQQMCENLRDTRARDGTSVRTKHVVLRAAKVLDANALKSHHRIGVGVAVDNISSGIANAIVGRFSVDWFADSAPESSRLYFNLQQQVTGVDGDEINATALVKLLQNDRVDLMCSTDPRVAWSVVARNLWARRTIPVASMLHSIHNTALMVEVLYTALIGGLHEFDSIISPSACGAQAYNVMLDQVREHLQNQGTKACLTPRIEVIPYGIDLASNSDLHPLSCKQSFDIAHDRTLLLYFGRLNRYEKADLIPLLLVTRDLLKRGHNIHLALAGGGSVRHVRALEAAVKEFHLIDRVSIFDNVSISDKALLFGAADIFVALSDNIQETYGLTVVEAMAAGKPVVAAAWNGYREIVRDRDNGFLIPTTWTDGLGDYPALQLITETLGGYGHRDLFESLAIDLPALLRALETLLESPDLRQSMGSRGRAIAEQEYDIHRQSDKIVELLADQCDTAAKISWAPLARAPLIDRVDSRFAQYAMQILQPTDKLSLGKHSPDAQTVARACNFAQSDELAILTCLTQRDSESTVQELTHLLQSQYPNLNPSEAILRILRGLKYDLLERV